MSTCSGAATSNHPHRPSPFVSWLARHLSFALRTVGEMVILLSVIAGNLGYCVGTLWGLQERRFSAVFEAVSEAARYMTMGLVFCFFSLQRREQLGFGSPFAFI